MKKTYGFFGLLFAVFTLFLFSCKQEAEDVDVTVSTETATSYSYYYSMNSGSVDYSYNSYYTNDSTYYSTSTTADIENVNDGGDSVNVSWETDSTKKRNYTVYTINFGGLSYSEKYYDSVYSNDTYSYYYYLTTQITALPELTIYKIGSKYYLGSATGADITSYVSGLEGGSITFTSMPFTNSNAYNSGSTAYLTLSLSRY